MRTNRKTTLENISPQFLRKKWQNGDFTTAIRRKIEWNRDNFIEQKLNCGEIFSRLVFLYVTMSGYSAMMPETELDFMLLTDISIVMWGSVVVVAGDLRIQNNQTFTENYEFLIPTAMYVQTVHILRAFRNIIYWTMSIKKSLAGHTFLPFKNGFAGHPIIFRFHLSKNFHGKYWEGQAQSDFGKVYSVKGQNMKKLDCPSFPMVCGPMF